MKNFTLLRLFFFLAALGLAGCSGFPVASKSGLLDQLDTVIRQAAPDRPVSLTLTSTQVKTGDVIQAQVVTKTEGYLYLFQVDTNGRSLSLLFPNSMDGANYIAADATLVLPRSQWRMAARGPAGVGYLMAVLTDKPQDLIRLYTDTNVGKITLTPPFGATMVMFHETAP